MTPERWQQVKNLLGEALEKNPGERQEFLTWTCRGDDTLLREVQAYLASADEVGDFIEEPAVHLLDGDTGLPAGQRLGPYQIDSEIGRGGMGAVYLAHRADQEFEKKVAIKLVKRGMDTDEIVRRFRHERQILANLDHPNIARLLDGGTTADGLSYFVMEHVEGEPIDDYCRRRDLPPRERLALFRTVCSAVQFAHQRLVVHRDLKPGNILVTADGVPKLLDFGIAKLLDSEQPFATVFGHKLLTPEYASPEQVEGGPPTTASDVYSLGVLLHLLLTGELPASSRARRRQLRSAGGLTGTTAPTDGPAAGAAPESSGGAALTGELGTIVAKAMHEDRERRYASVEQLSEDVRRYLEGLPVLARPDTFAYRTGKFVRRHKLPVTLAAGVLLLILGSSVWIMVLWQRALREQERTARVKELLEQTFEINDPSEARGREVTAFEILESGREQIARDKELDEEPEVKADLLATLGRVYRNLGLYEEARKLLQESLGLRRAAFGPDHPLVAESLHNLAFALRKLGNDAGAEPLLNEALEIQRQNGLEDDPEYLRGLNNLAALYEKSGRLPAAEELYRDVLARKNVLLAYANDNERVLDVARGENNLAAVLQGQGQLAEAETLYRSALQTRQRVLPAPHPQIASSLNNLASALEDRGDLDQAEALYREAVAMRRQLNPEGPELAQSLSNLGLLLQRKGDSVGAEAHLREALEVAAHRLQDHPDRAVLLRNLAALLVAQGRGEEAEPLVREALTILRQHKPRHWRVADVESVLGGCLAAQGRFDDAEKLLLRSFLILRKSADARYSEEALRRLIDLYTAWGKKDSAEAYRAMLPAPGRAASAASAKAGQGSSSVP